MGQWLGQWGTDGHCTEERLHLCCGEDRQAMGALHWQMGGRASFLQYLARLIKIVYIVFGIRLYYIPAVTLCYLALPCYLVRSGNKPFTEISIEYVAGVLLHADYVLFC